MKKYGINPLLLVICHSVYALEKINFPELDTPSEISSVMEYHYVDESFVSQTDGKLDEEKINSNLPIIHSPELDTPSEISSVMEYHYVDESFVSQTDEKFEEEQLTENTQTPQRARNELILHIHIRVLLVLFSNARQTQNL